MGGKDDAIWRSLFDAEKRVDLTLTKRVRVAIVHGILSRRVPLGTELPATRTLASLLGIARNTVSAAYDHLVQDGFVIVAAQKRHVVNPALRLDENSTPMVTAGIASTGRFRRALHHPVNLTAINRPADWRAFPFPFVHGQVDRSLFPVHEWREAVLATGGPLSASIWSGDQGERDDPYFVEQLRSRVLPRRGIWVPENQILVTVGAQNAIFLAAYVLLDASAVVAVERLCYPDVRNIFLETGARIAELPVDRHGPAVTAEWPRCDVAFVMPSHQNPTTTTMSASHREALLHRAAQDDFLLIEDDYDSELVFAGQPQPAIKAGDRDGRVIYVGSLSKTLAPGLRVGYLVGPPAFIDAARAVRQLMMRHPPANNQRAAAHFIALGHHQRYMARLVLAYKERVNVAIESLSRHLPQITFEVPSGGSALWLHAPAGVDLQVVEQRCREQGLLFDSGHRFVAGPASAPEHFRLGLCAIDTAVIDEGIRVLARAMTG